MPMTVSHRQPWPITTAMRQAVPVDLFWMMLVLAGCAAMVYVSRQIEPHYVSRSGHRFLCTGQWISKHGEPEGRKREVWVNVLSDGEVQMDVKRGMRRDVSHWTIEGKAAEPPPRRATYLLRGHNPDGTAQRMTITLPAKSRAVVVVDEAIAGRQ